jgi:hypothetical protein
MSQETLQATAQNACAQSAADARGAVDATSTRRPPRGAWLIRAAAVVYLVATAIIAWLVFSAV